jgi:hypothetical protein
MPDGCHNENPHRCPPASWKRARGRCATRPSHKDSPGPCPDTLGTGTFVEHTLACVSRNSGVLEA